LAYAWGVSERSYPNSRGWSAFLNDRWPALIGLAAGTLGLIDDGIDGSEVTTPLAVVTLIMAAAYLPIGAYRRQLGDPKVLLVETVGVLAFGALVLGALLAEGGSRSTSWRPPGSATEHGTSPTTGSTRWCRGGTRSSARSWM
jgi:hypothetical protein